MENVRCDGQSADLHKGVTKMAGSGADGRGLEV